MPELYSKMVLVIFKLRKGSFQRGQGGVLATWTRAASGSHRDAGGRQQVLLTSRAEFGSQRTGTDNTREDAAKT